MEQSVSQATLWQSVWLAVQVMWETLLLPTMLLPCYYCHIITAHVVTAHVFTAML